MRRAWLLTSENLLQILGKWNVAEKAEAEHCDLGAQLGTWGGAVFSDIRQAICVRSLDLLHCYCVRIVLTAAVY